KRGPTPPRGRPIRGLRRSGILGRPARSPITIKNVERNPAISESIRTHRQSHAVDREHAQAVIAFHRSSARGKANVRTMNFHKTSRRSSRQPSKKIHHPLPAICSFPRRAATFIVTKQRFGGRSDRHLLVITFRFRPT